MPKASKPGYYAVRKGRVPGIYPTWDECEAQIKGFRDATYKKLSTEAEARAFMATKPSAARMPASRDVVPVASTSRSTINADPKLPSKSIRSKDADENDRDVVYCDGACKGNGQLGSVAGIGVWWGHDDPRNISERCPGDQTNNRAELIAIVRILETTPRLKRPLLIKTDSNYSIQCVTTWIFKWMRNGFLTADGKPVKNRALIKYLAALLHARRKTSQTIEFKHVRGHVGIEGNEAADQLANLGAIMPVVPEKNWQELEKEVLQSLEPVQPIKLVDDELQAYANALFNDDELAEIDDASDTSIEPLVRASGRQDLRDNKSAVYSHTFAFSGPREVSKAARVTGAILTSPPSRKPPTGGSTSATTLSHQSIPSKKPTTAISKEELEIYASCLLSDHKLLTLGKDGVFDSDF